MILEEICNSSVYENNAFYLLGLTVDATSRTIRRRQEDLIDGLSEMGAKAWEGEFDKYLLGNVSAPKIDDAKELFDRLKDPEYFVTEMFFWFWPQKRSDDQAVDAIIRGERDAAVRTWYADMGKPGIRGIVARHNLAVALHYYAIDGEKLLRSGTCKAPDYLRMVDQYWRSSFELWENLEEDDGFWDVFAGKVQALNDPRLDEGFVESFRERFPVCFDNINADFMVAYARSKDMKSAKRHFDYMVATMSDVDDVEETMERCFKPMVDKVRVLIGQCGSVKEPKKVLAACRELLKGSEDLVAIFKALVPKGNSYTKEILNEIVAMVDSRLPAYSRETGDYEPCLQITRELLSIAATPLVAGKIQDAIKEWDDLVKQDREMNTCCVCGRYQKGIGKKTVKMYGQLRADPLVYGRVEWNTRTISNVPVCSSCSSKFTPKLARNFTPVKLSLSQGWKFGERPSQREIDAV